MSSRARLEKEGNGQHEGDEIGTDRAVEAVDEGEVGDGEGDAEGGEVEDESDTVELKSVSRTASTRRMLTPETPLLQQTVNTTCELGHALLSCTLCLFLPNGAW